MVEGACVRAAPVNSKFKLYRVHLITSSVMICKTLGYKINYPKGKRSKIFVASGSVRVTNFSGIIISNFK